MSAQLSRYGLHVIVSSYELMTAPRCCLNDSEISEFMPPGSNSGAASSSWSTELRSDGPNVSAAL